MHAPVVALCLLTVGASGLRCTRGPSLDEFLTRIREAAGPDARDCGVVSLHEPAEEHVERLARLIERGYALLEEGA